MTSARIIREALAVAGCRAPCRLAWTRRPEVTRTLALGILRTARAEHGTITAAITAAEAEEAAWRRKKEGVA